MNPKAVAIYYALSIVVLGTALFAIQPRDSSEVTFWQTDVQTRISIAWQQLNGDESIMNEVVSLFEGVQIFYDQSALAFIDLVKDDGTDEAIHIVFGRTYQTLVSAFADNSRRIAGESDIQPKYENFMMQEPIYDVLPAGVSFHTPSVSGEVFSISKPSTEPVNLGNPWFTALDASTGQEYCMAIYNGEVNKYLGACKYDYN